MKRNLLIALVILAVIITVTTAIDRRKARQRRELWLEATIPHR